MTSLDMISLSSLPNVKLEYVLEHCNNSSWGEGKVAKSRYSEELGGATNKSIRDVQVSPMDQELVDLLNKEIEPIVQDYARKYGITVSSNTSYSLAKYDVGQFFAEHTDATKEFPRKISAVLYLNDNYEGGTITFTKIKSSIKPNKNTLFIFPSTEEFSHSADPVISGTKYVIIGFWE